MAGTTWNEFVAGQKAKASGVNENFDWIEGHLYPMIQGSTTTNTYDVGSPTARWRDLHLGRNAFFYDDVVVASTKKILFDGTTGGDTYFVEGAANRIDAYAGNVNAFSYDNNNITIKIDTAVTATKKLWMDGGGDTYQVEGIADRMDYYAGNVNVLSYDSGDLTIKIHAAVAATKRFYVDGGGDTYIIEGSANSMDFYAGGNLSLKLLSTGPQITGDTEIRFTTANSLRERIDQGGGLNFYQLSITAAVFRMNWGGTYMDFGHASNTAAAINSRFRFYQSGTAQADAEWTTFSPDIRKDDHYKDLTTITADDYLNWALNDANKPFKPYNGIPHIKEKNETITMDGIFNTKESATTERLKYSKGIGKISIGVARWAEYANNKIKELETRIQQLESV